VQHPTFPGHKVLAVAAHERAVHSLLLLLRDSDDLPCGPGRGMMGSRRYGQLETGRQLAWCVRPVAIRAVGSAHPRIRSLRALLKDQTVWGPTFLALKASSRAQVFQPPGCAYYQYTRRQVQEHFQQNNVDIVVVGDSIIRQLFARAVHMLRGQVGPVQRPPQEHFLNLLPKQPHFVCLCAAASAGSMQCATLQPRTPRPRGRMCSAPTVARPDESPQIPCCARYRAFVEGTEFPASWQDVFARVSVVQVLAVRH